MLDFFTSQMPLLTNSVKALKERSVSLSISISISISLSLSLSLSLRFNGHFPGEPGLAGVY